MSAGNEKSFVVLSVCGFRFALPARIVGELVAAERLQKFPHATAWLRGVLVRRGRILPVCDVALLLGDSHGLRGKFYLVVRRELNGATEWAALPVEGECELVSGELLPPPEGAPPYVAAQLLARQERIEVLELAKLIPRQAALPSRSPGGALAESQT